MPSIEQFAAHAKRLRKSEQDFVPEMNVADGILSFNIGHGVARIPMGPCRVIIDKDTLISKHVYDINIFLRSLNVAHALDCRSITMQFSSTTGLMRVIIIKHTTIGDDVKISFIISGRIKD